ncbi:MAG: hypothetical protein HY769_07685 [Candidatus Stahlbacteria bacterium]|nr:hypothetical protein [Candidatus Stahlbacteria bacterium]
MNKKYIPARDAEFENWFRNFKTHLPVIGAIVGLPATVINKVVTGYAAWKTAYDAYLTMLNQMEGATATKNNRRDTAEPDIRTAVNLLQPNPGVSDENRQLLGITVRDTEPTPISEQIVATEPPPKIDVLCIAPKQVRIDWYPTQVGTSSEAKPEGIEGVAIWCASGGVPADESGWRFLALDTNSPYIHNVANNTVITMAYKACWFDRRKRMGPFCDPVVIAVTA